MNTATKLGAYALGLAAAFGSAAGIGTIVGPVGATAESGDHGSAHSGHSGGTAEETGTPAPGGLQTVQDGYTLNPETTTVTPGKQTDFRFTVTGPNGAPVTRYTPLHGEKLHLIIARRDLSGFQHVHPAQVGGGVWSMPLTLPDAGTYRFFTDVRPEGAKRQLTLGTDVSAPGDFRPEPLPAAERVAEVDGYEVALAGDLVPGRSSKLTLTVSKDGKPVTDLQPYLEAYGHLVALRDRDLAYLHVHPDGEPGDGRTAPGPAITFYAEVPAAGSYRLYLDFKHGDTVRTAEFTAVAGAPAPSPQSTSPAPSSPPAGEPEHGDHEH
ncbi:hypothetical protein [Spirillospora sp. NBC_01491]|uniref:hypothetical protein n=1 Tax=Spirillospora sp. NBC_01491 TaxID=2976007 RepID=UPI002E34FD67|nr:hypothetical protein [Spirillospora sp. NBC_01491]